MKYFFLLLFTIALLHRSSAQDLPNCSASLLQLEAIEIGFSDLIATLSFTPQEEVITYDLQHDYLVDGQLTSDIIVSTGPTVLVTMVGETVHTFTALNRCSDGSTHTGSTFSIDLGQNSLDFMCPAPTNLVIDAFNAAFVQFHWDQADSADFWQVTYQPEGLPDQSFTVAEPVVEQVLEPTVRHTFSLYAVCDDQMFAGPLTQTQSPTVTFRWLLSKISNYCLSAVIP